MTREWTSTSVEETARIAGEIAPLLPGRGWVALNGDLGAGKTTLVRSLVIAAGGSEDDVASPTFAIIHEYPLAPGRTLWHLDAYRLSDEPREWEQIGIPDLLSGDDLVLVEWPKQGFERWAPSSGSIAIEDLGDDSRRIIFESASSACP